MKSVLLVSFFILLLYNATRAQVCNEYSINLYNGLASNYVYNTTVDHFGYLWICTNNGLYRYNGYNVLRYSLRNGLPNNDVWGLIEDKKHRLWVQTISNTIGYLYNKTYHNIVFNGPGVTFYPRVFAENNKGMFFNNPEDGTESLYTEYKDTLHFTGFRFKASVINGDNDIITLCEEKIKRYTLKTDNQLELKSEIVNRVSWSPLSNTYAPSSFKNYVVYRHNSNTYFLKQNIITGEIKKVSLTDSIGNKDTILFFGYSQTPYIIASHAFYVLDTSLNIVGSCPVNTFVNEPEKIDGGISAINRNGFWGNIISTKTRGVILNLGNNQHFEKIPGNDLASYKYIGKIADTISYWWNQNSKVLLSISRRGRISRQTCSFLYDIVKMTPYDKERTLLVTKTKLYWFFNRRQLVWPTSLVNVDAKLQTIPTYHRGIIVTDTNHIFLTGYNFYSCTIKGDTAIHKIISSGGRYDNAEPDSAFKAFWLYNNDQVLFLPFQGKGLVIDRTQFKQYGIRNVEKIIRDQSSGMLFLKDNANLFKLDLNRHTIQKLFRNYNLENTLFYISNNKIILAGKFGVLFSPVNATEDAAILYPNIKNSLYHTAQDAAILEQEIILKTDKGFYSLSIPGDNLFRQQSSISSPYKVILEYRDTLYDIAAQRVFNIVDGNKKIGVDFINPHGNGTLTVLYFIAGVDTAWNTLNGDEISLPALSPRKNYTLYLKASDAIWNSKVASVNLHIVPLWWQTLTWQTIFLITGIIATIGILLTVMLLTRRYVIRANDKKRYSTMLELRAIYAQLNPHFIFNTLNTALYFIKKKRIEEAATHVTTFSRLLRAYLDSSRNRYIAIDDEITNLRNYILLQQKRFENTFTYEIVNNIQPHKTFYIPSLLLQPIVENAINHGLLPKGKDGHLKIGFTRNIDKSIVCFVDDNGIGRQQSIATKQGNHSSQSSNGSRLIHELTEAFNKYEKLGIEITYVDKAPPLSGTVVTILIKTPHDN